MQFSEDAVKEQQTRTEETSEVLSDKIRFDFEMGLEEFRKLEPRILETRRRFQLLSKDKRQDGKLPSIEGCLTFKEWCMKVLGRPEKVVMYLLQSDSENKEHIEKVGNVTSFSFTKGEQKRVDALLLIHARRLGRLLSRKEQKQILHEEFGLFLNVYEGEEQ